MHMLVPSSCSSVLKVAETALGDLTNGINFYSRDVSVHSQPRQEDSKSLVKWASTEVYIYIYKARKLFSLST